MSNTTNDKTNNKNKSIPKPKPKSNAGRKNKYFTHVQPHLEKIKSWVANGDFEKTIYERLGIGKNRFYEYKKEHEEFMNALKNGEADLVGKVENALFKSACGYEYEEVTEEYDGEGKLLSRKVFKKHMSPSTSAQVFYLKNKRPDKWVNSDRIEIQQSKEQMDIHRELVNTIKQRNTLDKKIESE